VGVGVGAGATTASAQSSAPIGHGAASGHAAGSPPASVAAAGPAVPPTAQAGTGGAPTLPQVAHQTPTPHPGAATPGANPQPSQAEPTAQKGDFGTLMSQLPGDPTSLPTVRVETREVPAASPEVSSPPGQPGQANIVVAAPELQKARLEAPTELIRTRGSAPAPAETPAAQIPTGVSVTGVTPQPDDDPDEALPTSFRPKPIVGPRRPAVEGASAPARRASSVAGPPAVPRPASQVASTPSAAPPAASEVRAPATRPDRVPTHVAIDFGGRWTRVGYLAGDRLELVRVAGQYFVPSMVAARPAGGIATGVEARSIGLEQANRAIQLTAALSAVKGSGLDPGTAQRLPQLKLGPSGQLMVALGDVDIALKELLRAFFEALANATAELGAGAMRAVLAAPLGLDPAADEMLAEAARAAGFESVRVIPEPLAMVHAYRLDAQPIDSVLTVDLGSSHVGLALVRRGKDGFSVVAQKRDGTISAGELDTRVVDLVLEELLKQEQEDRRADNGVRLRVIEAVERARTQIRRDQMALDIRVPLSAPNAPGPVVEKMVKLPRSRIYQSAEPVIERLMVAIRELFQTANVHPKSVGAVIVAGSAGSFPPLVQALQTMAQKDPLTTLPATEVVARGLAAAGIEDTSAQSAAGAKGATDTLDSAIGIGLPGGRFRPLIPQGAKLPVKLSRKHATTRDGQTEIELSVYQGGGEFVQGCTHLGTLQLTGIPKAPRGDVQVDFDIELSTEGVVTVTLSEESSGKKVRFRAGTLQTPAEKRPRGGVEDLSDPTKAKQKVGLFGRLLGKK
jgi:molecular chaperone DnaK